LESSRRFWKSSLRQAEIGGGEREGCGLDECKEGLRMIKVKTFATELKIFHTMKELYDLDEKVNQFIKDNNINKIVSVSDTCTTDDKGATIGVIRVIAYE
jgi:hypothetical protein